jgi:radical SAM modification target selenobiotic family peptide
MDIKELKKILAGLCLASLMSGSGLVFAAGSGSG